MIEPERMPLAQFDVRFVGPAHPKPGDVVAVEIVVTGAEAGERHRFRIRPCHASVRLVDSDAVTTVGAQAVRVRFTSDVAAAGAVVVEPVE